MGDIYDMAKDITRLESEVENFKAILQQLYDVIEYNLKEENIVEPKEPKAKK